MPPPPPPPSSSAHSGDSLKSGKRLPIGTRVKCVYNSMMFDSIEHAREVRRNQMASRFTHQEVKYEEKMGVIGGVSDQEGHDDDDVIYR